MVNSAICFTHPHAAHKYAVNFFHHHVAILSSLKKHHKSSLYDSCAILKVFHFQTG